MGFVAGLLAGTACPAFAAPTLLQTKPAEADQTAPRVVRNEPLEIDPTLANDRLRPGVYPAQPVPAEFAVPAPTAMQAAPLDWSVGLRGTYSAGNDVSSFVTHLTPRFSYTHAGGIADVVVDGSADIAKVSGQDAPVLALGALSVSATAPIDSATTLSARAAIGLSQDLPGAIGLSPAVITPPQILTGSLALGLDRQFGQFNLGLDGGLTRTAYGPTNRTDTGLTDNADQNYWSGDAGLRLGYQITPIIEVFGEAGLERDIFDQPSKSLGLYPNATNRTLRAGIAADWNDVWSASASVGVGERVFDEASLGAVRAQLYGAEIQFTPDPTVVVTAGLETALAPSGADNPGTARVQYSALADAQYTVNSWLRMRASAGWSYSELVGAGTTEKRLSLGAGADYAVSAHTSLNADYGYANSDNSTGNTQSHLVSLGITVAR
ncbi:hypothetical protein DMC47_02070 [Nostoc sp. 3335mG]|nr:hypothetical protein DMC47_02070 [Nostoc sp. 3335mG]